MLRVLVFIMLISTATEVHSQIARHNWLVGGSATGMYRESEISDHFIGSYRLNERILNSALQLGYFPIKNFAVGLIGHYTGSYIHQREPRYNRGGWPATFRKQETWSAGSFARCYILPQKSRINFYLQGAYELGEHYSMVDRGYHGYDGKIETNFYKIRAAQASIAPVFFLSKKVSLEMVIAYTHMRTDRKTRYVNVNVSNNFTAGIGFQIHLGKVKAE